MKKKMIKITIKVTLVILAIIGAFQLGIKTERVNNQESQVEVSYSYRWTANDGHSWCYGDGALIFPDIWRAQWFLEEVDTANKNGTYLIVDRASIVEPEVEE